MAGKKDPKISLRTLRRMGFAIPNQGDKPPRNRGGAAMALREAADPRDPRVRARVHELLVEELQKRPKEILPDLLPDPELQSKAKQVLQHLLCGAWVEPKDRIASARAIAEILRAPSPTLNLNFMSDEALLAIEQGEPREQ